MLIRSQNELGYVNMDNVAYIHIVSRNIVSEDTKRELELSGEDIEKLTDTWCINAKIANSVQEVELGRYPSEDACVDIMRKFETAYKDTTMIHTTHTSSYVCYPQAKIFNMPRASDYKVAESEAGQNEKEDNL